MNLDKYKVNVPEGTIGLWTIDKFEIKEDSPGRFYYAAHGRPVPVGVFTRLTRKGDWDPMMSDTEAEILDHMDIIRKLESERFAAKRVLINGLGIGMILQCALKQPHIEHVDVVEIESDVIGLVGDHYMAMAKECGKTLVIHNEDAFNIKWDPGTKWDLVWHDIWPSICSDNLPEMKKLKYKYGRRTKWQACWAEEECRRY